MVIISKTCIWYHGKIRDFAFDISVDYIFSGMRENLCSECEKNQTTNNPCTFSFAVIVSLMHTNSPEFISEGMFLHWLISWDVWNSRKDNILRCLFSVIKCSSAFWQTDPFILWSCATSVDISISQLMTLSLCILLCLESWVCFPYKSTGCFWHTRDF